MQWVVAFKHEPWFGLFPDLRADELTADNVETYAAMVQEKASKTSIIAYRTYFWHDRRGGTTLSSERIFSYSACSRPRS